MIPSKFRSTNRVLGCRPRPQPPRAARPRAFFLWVVAGTLLAPGAVPGVAQEAAAPTGQAEVLSGVAQSLQAELAERQRLSRVFEQAVGESRSLARQRQLRHETKFLDALEALVRKVEREGTAGSARAQAERELAQRTVRDELVAQRGGIEALESRDQEIRIAIERASPEEQLEFERELSALHREIDDRLAAIDRVTHLANRLAMDASETESYLEQALLERADSAAGGLEILLDERAGLERMLARAGEDEKPALSKRLSALSEKLDGTSETLERVADLLAARGVPVAEYRQLLIRATGVVSGDILDRDVASGLLEHWWSTARDRVRSDGARWLWNALLFVLILAFFWFLSRLARRIVSRALAHTEHEVSGSQLLGDFFRSTVSKGLLLLGLLIALSQVGVQVGPFLAGLGVMGFILGFALQDSLSNFASGIMILLYRPYDVGDSVSVAGINGKVDAMNLVSTTILTFDNQKLIVPNNKIWGDTIQNTSALAQRRVDLKFSVSYEDDVDLAESILNQLIAEHELVLDEPEPIVRLHALAASSIDFIVRPWTRAEDYWTVYWDITRAVKKRFDEAGISIPYPQQTVHLVKDPVTPATHPVMEERSTDKPTSEAEATPACHRCTGELSYSMESLYVVGSMVIFTVTTLGAPFLAMAAYRWMTASYELDENPFVDPGELDRHAASRPWLSALRRRAVVGLGLFVVTVLVFRHEEPGCGGLVLLLWWYLCFGTALAQSMRH